MKRFLTLAALAATTVAAPALAQDANSWTGPYVGFSAGWDFQPGDGDERINFDTNLDGNYNDTVRTVAGANAFSPGFCGGATGTPTPAAGCVSDKDDVKLALNAGYDYDLGGFVVGAVVEGGIGFARDYVTAYSTTPAFYTMERRVRENANARLRAGYAFGAQRNTLVYATGGGAWGRMTNRFFSNNVANARSSNGNYSAWGWTAGGGIEQRVTNNFSVGLRYLYTDLKADDARVRLSQGSAPATNPFVLVNAGGTDLERSHSRFVTHNVSVTGSFRF